MIFKKGDYVYHSEKGLGIIEEECSGSNNAITQTFKIRFPGETIITPKNEEYKFLSKEFIKTLDERDFSFYFSNASYTKGEMYYLNKSTLSFNVEDNLFKGVIQGTSNYVVYISFSDKAKLNMECTCPYLFTCKHEVAFLLFLSDYIHKSLMDLENANEGVLPQAFNYNGELDQELFKKIMNSTYQKEDENYVKTLEEVIEKLSLLTDEEKIAYFNILYQNKQLRNMRDFMIIGILSLHDDTSLFKKFKYEIGVFYTSLYREIKNNATTRYHFSFYADERIELLKALYNNKVDAILLVLSKAESSLNFASAIISYLIPKLEVNKSNTSSLLDFVRIRGNDTLQLIRPYIEKCDFLSLRDFLSFSREKDLISVSDLDKIKDETIFTSLGKIVRSEEAINYILNCLERLFSISKEKTLMTLHYFLEEIRYQKRGMMRYDILDDIKLLDPYISYLKSDRLKSTILDKSGYQKVEFNEKMRDYFESILDGFDVRYEFSCDENSYIKTYKVVLHDFKEDVNLLKIEEKNEELKLVNNYVDRSKDYFLSYYLVQKLEEEKKEQIQKDLASFKELQRTYIERINDEKISNWIQNYKEIVKVMDAPLLRDDEKIRLEYTIIVNRVSSYLSLRVGQNKLYMVQNMERFLSDFSSRSYDRYGKTFGFYHTLENLSMPHQEVMKYLLKTAKIHELNHKYLLLDGGDLDELFQLLQGEVVRIGFTNYTFFLDSDLDINDYLVSLDELDYTTSIDQDYKLGLKFSKDINMKNICIIDGDKASYVVNKGSVYQLNGTLAKRELLKFTIESRDFSIKNNLDDFINEIYLRNPDVFTIDEKVKRKFDESKININLYFDYDDKVIKASEKTEKEITDEKTGETKIIELAIDELSNMDKAKVEKVKDYLSYIGFTADANHFVMKQDDKILNFFRMDFSALKELANVYLSESIKSKKVVTFPKTQYRIEYNNGLMTILMEESKFSKEELNDILAKMKKKKKFILLKDNTILDLESEEAKKFELLTTDFSLSAKDLTEGSVIPVYQALKAYSYTDSITLDEHVKEMVDNIAHFKEKKTDFLEFDQVLRSYQKEGVKWLSVLSDYHMGGILADDMGLGKTLQIIVTLKLNQKEMPSLVVCPKTLIFNWQNEFKKFDPLTKVIPIYGLAPEREKIIKGIKNKERVIYITSYDSLRNDIEHYHTLFHYVILDEAQVIKNVQALKSQSVKKLKSEVKFALTGTPIENNILDLWSIFDFILPSYFGPIDDFYDRYEHDEEYLKVIIKKISPFILRRCKKDVLLDLPPKVERIVTVEMKKDQQKVYDAFIAQAKDMLSLGSNGTFQVLQFLTRLRQICVDPSMFVENYFGNCAKLEYLKENIKGYIEEGHKVLLFSQFVKGLESVEKILKEEEIPYLMLTGETKAQDRISLCDRFNKDSSKEKVFLISLKAGGNGINLTGADTVIHLDPWWNVSAENQATDRAHRIGQMSNVLVIKLIVENSIEQRVIELQNLKKDLIDKVIANDDSSITHLTQEDLKFILS